MSAWKNIWKSVCTGEGIKVSELDMTEKQFYELPLDKQRRLLNLGSGQNPPAPSYLELPEPTLAP